MKILAIDTACSACSVALAVDGTVVASDSAAMARGHAEALMPMVQSVMAQSSMAQAGRAFSTLDLVAVTVGPGSFTGLRTGLAAARGIGLAQNIPVAGVTTLEAVAAAAARGAASASDLPILVVLETRRADLYVQRFGPSSDRGVKPESETLALPAEAVLSFIPETGALLAGDGAERLLAVASPALRRRVKHAETACLPDAADVAAIALARAETPLAAAPLYIHPPAVRRPAGEPA